MWCYPLRNLTIMNNNYLDIFHIVLYASLGLLITALFLYFKTFFEYMAEKRKQPKEGTVVKKIIRPYILDYQNSDTVRNRYFLTVSHIREEVVLEHTFEVSERLFNQYNIGELYKGVG